MRIFKIFDHGCPTCEQMSQFDSEVVFSLRQSDKPLEYRTRELGAILDPDTEDEDNAALAHYAEIYAVNPDYTIDLPVYFVLEGKKYLGHLVGEHSRDELKAKLEKIVSGASNSKSKDHLFT